MEHNPKIIPGRVCPCGKPAVRLLHGKLWTCQDCLDKDPIVEELHHVARGTTLSTAEWVQSITNRKEKQRAAYYAKKHT